MIAVSGVISAKLTIAQLNFQQIDSLSDIGPGDICIEQNNVLANRIMYKFYDLPYDDATSRVTGGVGLVSDLPGCVAAVLSGRVTAFVSDQVRGEKQRARRRRVRHTTGRERGTQSSRERPSDFIHTSPRRAAALSSVRS